MTTPPSPAVALGATAFPPVGNVVTHHDVERDEFDRCIGCLYSAGHALDCPLCPQAGGAS